MKKFILTLAVTTFLITTHQSYSMDRINTLIAYVSPKETKEEKLFKVLQEHIRNQALERSLQYRLDNYDTKEQKVIRGARIIGGLCLTASGTYVSVAGGCRIARDMALKVIPRSKDWGIWCALFLGGGGYLSYTGYMLIRNSIKDRLAAQKAQADADLQKSQASLESCMNAIGFQKSS